VTALLGFVVKEEAASRTKKEQTKVRTTGEFRAKVSDKKTFFHSIVISRHSQVFVFSQRKGSKRGQVLEEAKRRKERNDEMMEGGYDGRQHDDDSWQYVD
jgi:hypothetical protein